MSTDLKYINEQFTKAYDLYNSSQYEEAITIHSELLELVPQEYITKVHFNIGLCYKGIKQFSKAEYHLLQALKDPKYYLARLALLELYCYIGDWFGGFKYYDWNYAFDGMFHYDFETSKEKRLDWEDPQTQRAIALRFDKPIDDIILLKTDDEYRAVYQRALEKVKDKTIHIISTQGLGDVIQCSYFINELLKYEPKKIIFSARLELVRLMSEVSKDPRVEITHQKLKPTHYDYFLPSFNLVKLFEDKPDNLKDGWITIAHRDKQYFKIHLYKMIEKVYGNDINGKTIVGLNWKGNPAHHMDKKRSMSLEDMLELNKIDNAIFISFQFGPTDAEKELFKKYNVVDLSSMIHDVYDMACFMSNIGYLYSVDSAPIHLAGAIGTPSTCFMPAGFEDYRWGFIGQQKLYKSVFVSRLP